MDLISRKAAITAICEDGTWLERQGCTEITMAERMERDVDILNNLLSFSRDHENDHSAEVSKMDDPISRQAAIDAHCELCGDRGKCNCDICPDVEVFQLLPSVQPEPDTRFDTRLYSDGFDDGYKQAINDAQPEITEEDVKEYCRTRCLIVLTSDLFEEMKKRWSSVTPKQQWIPCGKCIHADGEHRWCKVLDRTINEDYFCCWAEPYREEGDE